MPFIALAFSWMTISSADTVRLAVESSPMEFSIMRRPSMPDSASRAVSWATSLTSCMVPVSSLAVTEIFLAEEVISSEAEPVS